MTDAAPEDAPRIERILFPSDLSPESDRALGHVRLLADRFGAQVTLFHALEVPAARWIRATHEDALLRAVAEEATAELEVRAGTLPGPTAIVVEGAETHPASLADIALLRHIQETRPDLVVMASQRRGDLRSFFLGSVAQQVVEHAGCPVLVVGPGGPPTPPAYARIVVPTDFSEASRRAFPIAAVLARRFQAELLVVHVVPRPLLAALANHPQALAAAVPSAAQLRDFAATVAGLEITPRVLQGSPWNGIVEVARQEHADLIVMARSGADNLGERLLGSQTERVIRHATCPVLAV